jgi:hypothetical protein
LQVVVGRNKAGHDTRGKAGALHDTRAKAGAFP